ncbi:MULTISPECIES: RNA polymerase sigma factor [unclassified Phycicoccus]|uniref:RNA polymerase sigma factor n=1 Tax=unclassified Phycicoccus TaxID=2637926 RepID=UPI0009EC528E|nr:MULTISPECIES: SigE family RNA polymerase sigma factor [unclassified Phycicoccus]
MALRNGSVGTAPDEGDVVVGTQSAEAEFDAFYRDTARRVVHLVYGFTGDLTVAQDSTQEAYARAWQQWSTVRTHDDPLAWVRTVARRVAISGWRKKTTQDRAYERHGVRDTTGPPTEDRVAVVAALRTLSEPLREAVTLHYIGDLSIEQIAHETNTPAGTVKARLHRGRAQLAQALRHEETTHG